MDIDRFLRTGMITPFHVQAALATGFSARKRGMAGILALGFALLVFLFHGIFLSPFLPFMPDPQGFPLRWIVWSLFRDFAMVVMAAAAGASFDRWSGCAKALIGNLHKRLG